MVLMDDSNVICKICGKVCKNIQGLAYHLGSTKEMKVEDYYNKYMKKSKTEGICVECGNLSKFKNITHGYSECCSSICARKCLIIRERMRLNNLEKYGVEYSFQREDVKTKIKDRCIELYGVDNPSKSSIVNQKRKTTCSKKYGNAYYVGTEDCRIKRESTCLEKYGFKYAIQSQEIKEKMAKTNNEKYGGNSPACSAYVQTKMKQTSLIRYGSDNYAKTDIGKQRTKTTCEERYNSPCFLSSSIGKEVVRKSILAKHNVANPSQLPEVRQKLKLSNFRRMFTRILNSTRLKELCVPNFSIDDYHGVEHKYSWTCSKCNNIFIDCLDNGNIPRCRKCFPINSGTSNMEKEIFWYCESIGLVATLNNRTILSGKEIDIYIPEIKLAIEFDGLFWHSEVASKVHPNYHLLKTDICEKSGVQLIHIFEDEWLNKRDIVKSIISVKSGKVESKIFARKCVVKEVNNRIGEDFLFEHHIQGSVPGKFIGLYYNDELVGLINYGKPRFNKHYDFELYRFCTKKNTIVVGGLSKLLNSLSKKYPSKTLVSYCDRRYSMGQTYRATGFQFTGVSSPSYYYLKDRSRLNRLQFQKHLLKDKLPLFDETLTEWENMQLNGYDRIWDCGNLIFSRIL